MKKKLIDVAIPLEAINAASAREKSIRHGHPSQPMTQLSKEQMIEHLKAELRDQDEMDRDMTPEELRRWQQASTSGSAPSQTPPTKK